MSKRWLVIDTHGAMKIVEQEDTPVDAAYGAADRYGLSTPDLTVYPLGEPESYSRGWVRKDGTRDS